MSEEVKKHREAKRTADSSFDRIYKSYFNQKTRIELTEEEMAMRERWNYAWNGLNQMITRRALVSSIKEKFGVSIATAYADVNYSMMLFGSPTEANKNAKRRMMEDWITRAIKKAWEADNLDTYERLLNRYAKLNGLDEDDTAAKMEDMVKHFQPVQINLNFKVEELHKEAERIRSTLAEDAEVEK